MLSSVAMTTAIQHWVRTNWMRAKASLLPALSLLSGRAPPLSGPRRPVLEPTGWPPNRVDVALSDADSERVDPVYIKLDQPPLRFYETGEAWKRCFDGSPSRSRGSLRITEARLEFSFGFFILRMTYIVQAVLTYEGREFPLHAEGTETFSAMFLDQAVGDAVYGAISSMVKQVSAVIYATASGSGGRDAM